MDNMGRYGHDARLPIALRLGQVLEDLRSEPALPLMLWDYLGLFDGILEEVHDSTLDWG